MKGLKMRRLTLPALLLAAVIPAGIMTMAQTQTNGPAQHRPRRRSRRKFRAP